MRDTLFFDREIESFFEQLLSEFETAPGPPSVMSEDRSVPGLTQYVNIDLGMATSRSGRPFRLNPTTAIYYPPAFRPQAYDLIVYLHGHKGKYPGNTVWIDGYLNGSRFPFFALREEVQPATRNLLFVAPTLGPHSQAGMLEKNGGFDRYIEQVAQAVDARFQRSLPRPQRIYLAAHSGGGSPMRRIVLLKDQFAQRVEECWGFDSLYGGVSVWRQWAKTNPGKRLYVYYLSSTEQYARDLQKNSPPNVQVQRSSKGHFWVPKLHLQERIRGIGAGEREFEWDWEFEALNPFGEKGGGRIQNKKIPAPADLDTIAHYGGNRQVPIHRAAKAALERMIAAARADGIPHPQLLPTSAYRSVAEQQKLWEAGLKKSHGDASENKIWVARPGNSAHQSGRAVDLYLGVKNDRNNVDALLKTQAYKWLKKNAVRFGFYPYSREPWHWEYNPPAGSTAQTPAPAMTGHAAWHAALIRYAVNMADGALGAPVVVAKLADLFARGMANDNSITDVLFFAKYPDAPRNLSKEHPLAAEWTLILRDVQKIKRGVSPASGTAAPVTGEHLRQLGNTSDTIDWSKTTISYRRKYVMEVLVKKYSFPINGAAGIVGNLESESAIIPNRVEGSKRDNPMYARSIKEYDPVSRKPVPGGFKLFTVDEIVNRNIKKAYGPLKPGVGLAQWSTPDRRKGLFKHVYNNIKGPAILFNMDAQIDYLVTEMRNDYRGVYKILMNRDVSVVEASDTVLGKFEKPDSILYKAGGKTIIVNRTDNSPSIPRNKIDSALIVYEERAIQSQQALDEYNR